MIATALVQALSDADCRPRIRGTRGMALCPAHPDREPSLSLSSGTDGRTLVHCHAGCSQESVVAALGMPWAELGSDDAMTTRQTPYEPEPWVSPGDLSLYLEAAHETLLSAEAAGLARRYLRSRGVTGELVRTYKLGFGVHHTDRRLDWLRGRVIVGVWPRHVEGRAVPGVGCNKPEVRWLSAIGSRKTCGWWRTDDVDPSRSVVLTEGPMDVLGLHDATGGNAIATLSKTNIILSELRRLHDRGVREALLGLDADATCDQWREWLIAGRDQGVTLKPVIGPQQGDWGDLLTLSEDDYWCAASEALTHPEVSQ